MGHVELEMAMDPAKETRPIFLICGCRKYREYLDAAIARMDRPKWRTIGVVGDPDCGAPRLEGQIVTLPISDIYEALPVKIHAAFKWAYETFPKAPGVYKTDDDIIYHDMKSLTKAIGLYVSKPYWGLFIGVCPENEINPIRIAERFEDKTLKPRHQAAIYCYGHGYWVSRKAIEVLIANESEYAGSYLEDVCTGYLMNRAGWKPLHVPIAYVEAVRGPELLTAK